MTKPKISGSTLTKRVVIGLTVVAVILIICAMVLSGEGV